MIGSVSTVEGLPLARPSRGRAAFVLQLLAGIREELAAIGRVLRLLRWQVHLSWLGLLALSLVGTLGDRAALVALQGLVLLLLALVGIFSGRVAKYVRRRRWVRFPNGPEVAPHLPQALTVLTFLPFFVSTVVFYRDLGRHWPGFLPVQQWSDALALALNHFLHSELFFQLFESLEVRLGPAVAGGPGRTLLLVVHGVLSFVFIKLAVQIGRAAYFQARSLGSGEDQVLALRNALRHEDTADVQHRCREIESCLCKSVDALRAHIEAGGERAEEAWKGLVTLGDYALPYLERRRQAADGGERRALASLIDDLRARMAEPDQLLVTPPRRFGYAAGLVLLLLGGTAAAFFLPPGLALPATLAVLSLVAWLGIASRAWVTRLVRWRVLRAVPPNRLPLRMALWCLCLAPFLLAIDARLFQLLGTFPAAAPADVSFPACLGYVEKSLTGTGLCWAASDRLGAAAVHLQAGCLTDRLLTFLVRLIFQLGVITLLVAVGVLWFNRVFRGLDVSPNAELILREEALECEPDAYLTIGYHYRKLRAFFRTEMARAEKEEIALALAEVGFPPPAALPRPTAEGDLLHEAERRIELGMAYLGEGELRACEAELDGGLALLEGAPASDKRLELLTLGRLFRGFCLTYSAQYEPALAEFESLQTGADEWSKHAPDLLQLLHGFQLLCRFYLGRLADPGPALREGFDAAKSATWSDRAFQPMLPMLFGHAFRELNQLDEAEAAYRLAIGMCEQAEDPTMAATLRIRLAETLVLHGHISEGLAEADRARDGLEEAVRDGNLALRLGLHQLERGRGLYLLAVGRNSEAEAAFARGLELAEKLIEEGQRDVLPEVGYARNLMGYGREVQGDLAGALGWYSKTATLADPFRPKKQDEGTIDKNKAAAVPGRNPGRFGWLYTVAQIGVGRVLVGQGLSKYAIFRENPEIVGYLRPDPDDFTWEAAEALRGTAGMEETAAKVCDLTHLGQVLHALGEWQWAQRVCRQALTLAEAQLGTEHPVVAAALANLAHGLCWLSQEQEARPLYERALALEEAQPEGKRWGRALDYLADCCFALKDFDRSLELYTRVSILVEKQQGPGVGLARALIKQARVPSEQGSSEEAEQLYSRARDVAARAGPKAAHEHVASLQYLGGLAFARGNLEAGFVRARQAVEAAEQAFGLEHRNTAYAVQWLAECCARNGRVAEAVPLFERVLRIREALLPAEHPEVRNSLRSLAEACVRSGDHDRAVEVYRRMESPGELGVAGVSHVLQDGDNVIFFQACGTAILIHAFDHEQRVVLARRQARLNAFTQAARWLGEECSLDDGKAGEKDGAADGGVRRKTFTTRARVERRLIQKLVELWCDVDRLAGVVRVYLGYLPGASRGPEEGELGPERDYEVRTEDEEEASPDASETITRIREYVDGVLVESTEMRLRSKGDGKPEEEGSVTRWYETGHTYYQRTGSSSGEVWERAWHENGELAGELHWTEEGKTGTITYWYPSGQKRLELSKKDGELDGKELHWDERGNLVVEREWALGVQES